MKKSNLIQLTALCFILSLTAACGGKNSSGGNNGSKNAYLQAGTSVLAPALQNTSYGTQSLNILNQAKDWASRDDSGRILSEVFSRGQVQGSNTSTNNCTDGTFLKFFKYQVCKSGSLTNQTVSFVKTPTHYCTVQEAGGTIKIASVVSDQLPIDYWTGKCSLSSFSTYTKSQNVELMNVLGLNNGNWQLYGASYDQYNSNVIYLLVGEKNGSPSKMYAIDKGFHSVYNPVASQELSTGTITKTLFLR